MKELSIINKCETDKYGCVIGIKPSDIFPELAESEDERIRKWIIENIQETLDIDGFFEGQKTMAKNAIAWLEKQGEHANFRNKIQIGDKVTRNEDGVLVNLSQLKRVAKTADKVEPKFHQGEWITNGDYTWKIIEVKPLDYILQSQDGNIVDDTISYVDEQFHSFTIKDAKDGDVLCCESGWTCIFKTLVNDETFSSYCFMDSTKWFCETGSECHTLKEEFVKAYNGKIHPATKEQRNQLERAIADAWYKWNAEKKELKKIEQKPAWSEEDEKEVAVLEAYICSRDWSERHVNRALGIVDELVNKVKSLKDRIPLKQGWSEGDEIALGNALWCCKQAASIAKDENDMGNI